MNVFPDVIFPECYLRHPLQIVKWINSFCNVFSFCAIKATEMGPKLLRFYIACVVQRNKIFFYCIARNLLAYLLSAFTSKASIMLFISLLKCYLFQVPVCKHETSEANFVERSDSETAFYFQTISWRWWGTSQLIRNMKQEAIHNQDALSNRHQRMPSHFIVAEYILMFHVNKDTRPFSVLTRPV